MAHALTDAILGAAGAGNIGAALSRHRPPVEGRRLHGAAARPPTSSCAAAGYALAQADITIITERPKLGAHVAAMAAALAARARRRARRHQREGQDQRGMGFIGRGEGLAVIAVAMLEAR